MDDFQIALALDFGRHGGTVAVNTTILSFKSREVADAAYREIEKSYPKNGIFATAVKLYYTGEG